MERARAEGFARQRLRVPQRIGDGLSPIASLPAAPLRPWAPCAPIVRVDSPSWASEVGVRELHDNGFSRRGLGVADNLYLSSG